MKQKFFAVSQRYRGVRWEICYHADLGGFKVKVGDKLIESLYPTRHVAELEAEEIINAQLSN